MHLFPIKAKCVQLLLSSNHQPPHVAVFVFLTEHLICSCVFEPVRDHFLHHFLIVISPFCNNFFSYKLKMYMAITKVSSKTILCSHIFNLSSHVIRTMFSILYKFQAGLKNRCDNYENQTFIMHKKHLFQGKIKRQLKRNLLFKINCLFYLPYSSSPNESLACDCLVTLP